MAIGDQVLDVRGAAADGLLDDVGTRHAAFGLAAADLSWVLTWAPAARHALRLALHTLLHDAAPRARRDRAARHLRRMDDVVLLRPWRPPDFVDCFASRHHAENVAAVVPGARVPPAFDHLPLGYHGRASTIAVGHGDASVLRPFGQRRSRDGWTTGPTRRLDFEAELGLVVGPAHPAGAPLPLARAAEHLFGVCLLNDWSARDFQALESEPLGPFQAKSFHTSVGPWVVTAEALAPFRAPWGGRGRVVPDYLHEDGDAARGALAITVSAGLERPGLTDPGGWRSRTVSLTSNSAATLAWTPGQLLVHLASHGGGLPAGMLVATGTISGPGPERGGSLVELSRGGRAPVDLGSGRALTFLEDGDTVVLTGRCEAPGATPIGLGTCRATVSVRPDGLR